MKNAMIGQQVVVRDQRAGVFFGTLAAMDLAAKTAELTDARKLWRWEGPLAVEGVAAYGCRSDSRVTAQCRWIGLTDVIQICAAMPLAAERIAAVPVYGEK